MSLFVRLFISSLLITNLYGGEYRFGEGLQLGETPLYLGGYVSVDYANLLDDRSDVTLDDVALMLYGESGAWRFMSELEINDMYHRSFGENETTERSYNVHAERVYVSYEPNDIVRTTLGKFNSPIGFWNMVPINVLRDTTSNPLVTRTIMPRFTTGVDLDVTLGKYHQLILLLQATPDLDTLFHDENPYNNFDIDRHLSLGYRYLWSDFTFKLTGGYFRERDTLEAWYYGYAALRYEHLDWKVMGEYGIRQNSEGGEEISSAYLQGVYALNIRHQLIGRVESVDNEWINDEVIFWLAGYTYRPFASMALKAEYQRDLDAQWQKVLLSFSVLF